MVQVYLIERIYVYFKPILTDVADYRMRLKAARQPGVTNVA